jgi:hypothetical protein
MLSHGLPTQGLPIRVAHHFASAFLNNSSMQRRVSSRFKKTNLPLFDRVETKEAAN